MQFNVGGILFVCYGGGHVAMLAPVAKRLLDQGRTVTFIALTTARAEVDRLGIPAIGFSDLPEANSHEALLWGEELARELPEGGPVSRRETISYLGANFRDLVAEYGEVEARRRYSEAGRHAFLPVATMRRAIERIAPDLIVATSSPRTERAAIIAAGQLGIPSLCAVDLFAYREIEWVGQVGYASRLCVLNSTVREKFLKYGRKPEEVVVTGNPAFDALTSPEAAEAGIQLRGARGWNDGKKTLLWASQKEPEVHPFADIRGDPSLPRRVEEHLREIVAADPNLRLVVRYHSSERVSFEPAVRVTFSPVSEPINSLLHAVDVVLVTASTVGLQAALIGRPVISIDKSIFTPDNQYAAIGVSRGVRHLRDLRSAIDDAVRGRGATGATVQSSESATQKVMQVIDSLLP